MKTLKCVFVLLAFLGLSLVGCSNEQQSPVTPTDQGSLEKKFTREFTANEFPTGIIDSGIYRYPDGKILLRGHRGNVWFDAEFLPGDTDPDLLTGPGEDEINGITDPITGIGQWQGKLTLRPEAIEAAGGEWKFTWHGEATFNLTAWNGGPGWTIPLQVEGHGNGGALTGMQCRMELIISAPPDLSTWTAEAHGFIYSH